MKKFIAVILAIGTLMLTGLACGTQYEPLVVATPTVINPGEVALTMIMQKADAEATQMAVNVHLTATGQVVNATSTAQAYINGQATAEQARKDAQATDARQRQDAMATEQQRRDDIAATQAVIHAVATAQQAERNVVGTATAQQQAIYNSMTAQALPTHAMWTQAAIEQEQIIATNEVELSNLQVERQRKSNTWDALWKYGAATLAILAAVFVAVKYAQVREIKNDETGAIEAVFVSGQVVRPSLLPGPVLDLKSNTMPMLTDAENQAEIVRRSQGVEAIRAIPPNTSPQMLGGVMESILGASEPAPRFEILDANDAPPAGMLDAEALKALDKDWKEAEREQL